MSELKCSDYVYVDGDEPEHYIPCKCPVCGAFLKWNDLEIICTKCGAELLVIPDLDEETNEELEWGKICPIPKKEKVKYCEI